MDVFVSLPELVILPINADHLGLYRYVRLVVNLWAYNRLKPFLPSHDSISAQADVTVIVPTLDGGGEETLRSVFVNCPRKIILVTVDAADRKVEEMVKRMAVHETELRVESVGKANKRDQMMVGIQQAKTQYTIFADDDVVWPPELLGYIVAPFANSEIGGVATCQQLIRDQSQTLFQLIWGFLGELYLERGHFDCAATTYMDGGTLCISGRTAAYHTKILQARAFLETFCTETWAGNRLSVDDDNYSTRWVISQGWKTYLQYYEKALVLTGLEDNSRFLKQCLHWARSNWRSNLRSLFVEKSIWQLVLTTHFQCKQN